MTTKATTRRGLRLLILAALPCIASGQTLTTIYNFTSADGTDPGPLIQATDGNFYGICQNGGTYGSGTVFKVSATGEFTSLHQFTGVDGYAYWPSTLVQAADGNFYGTTFTGGTNNWGTVFRITAAGTLTTIYQFSGPDGAYPWAPLVQGSDGDLYGATRIGGTNNFNPRGGVYGFGTVFKITTDGTLTTLRRFWIDINGRFPNALVEGSDGNFYGSTEDTTIFSINSTTGAFELLWTDNVGGDPTLLEYPLVQGSDGYFYGMGIDGGAYGWGAFYKIDLSASPPVATDLYSFNCECETFAFLRPEASDGSFYGTTWAGGIADSNCVFGCGTVFRVASTGGLTTLWSFTNGLDGAKSRSGLVQGIDGNFYGTTGQGGLYGNGTVFRFTVPLSPPANQIAGFQFLNVFDSSYATFLIPSVANETYQLQYTDSMNPTNWLNSGVPITSIGGPLTTVDFLEPITPQRFYRFAITP